MILNYISIQEGLEKVY